MRSLAGALRQGSWGLARARAEASRLEHSPAAIQQLVFALLADEPELRKRAADVARRMTDHDAAPLVPLADELAGILANADEAESRTRWHLGLVVARVARTHEQRLRAARLLELLAGDESTVVRCSAIEGLALLATAESGLRDVAAETVERALRSGGPAERCRARVARQSLLRAGAWVGVESS